MFSTVPGLCRVCFISILTEIHCEPNPSKREIHIPYKEKHIYQNKYQHHFHIYSCKTLTVTVAMFSLLFFTDDRAFELFALIFLHVKLRFSSRFLGFTCWQNKDVNNVLFVFVLSSIFIGRISQSPLSNLSFASTCELHLNKKIILL